MTDQRLAHVFVELADTLVDEFDAVDFLSTLVERSIELLDADAAGVILRGARGTLHVVAVSSERVEVLELFEVQNEEGPCLDCLTGGEPVVNVDLVEAQARWPRFTRAAEQLGFTSTHALPLRLRETNLGAMNLFQTRRTPLSSDDLLIGQALADIATIGLLQERAVRESALLAHQLQSALSSRVSIEQAKGVLLAREQMPVESGFELMRSYSRRGRLPMRQVAQRVIDGELTAEDLRL
jgi:transcriptional regulator with GAF, ATPase, and Fis domain